MLADRISDRLAVGIVKARAKAAGRDSALFAGHSLRAGFRTPAARAGAPVWTMQEQSRQASLNHLLGCARPAQRVDGSAGKDFAQGH